MEKDKRKAMQRKIAHLQETLEEYRLHADFSLAVQVILHNIRNSTTGSIISGEMTTMLADSLLENIDNFTTEELREQLKEIRKFSELTVKSIRGVDTLSQEILAKGKTDNSHDIESFNLNKLIEDEVKFLGYTSPVVCSKITVGLNLNPKQIMISARRHDIVQVFENLTHNAIESIAAEGKVEISTDCDAEFAYFSISDTGSGITKENLNKIFEPFFTTKKTTDKLTFFGGTGLGLHSCKTLIDSYKGDIVIDGHLNPGSKFTVKLPLN